MFKHRSVLLLLLLCSCQRVMSQNEDDVDRLTAEINIMDLELSDYCEDIADAVKATFYGKDFQEKKTIEQGIGSMIKDQAKLLEAYDEPYDEGNLHAWKIYKQPGDPLLPDGDWDALVNFANANQELVANTKTTCAAVAEANGTIKYSDYQEILHTSRNETMLKASWSRWQKLFATNKKKYVEILRLVNKAAEVNGAENARQYWEMLAAYPDAYASAEGIWSEIEPLYQKLLNFVKVRLLKHYKHKNITEPFPVYLLGTNFGEDWSYIADMILPSPQLHYDAVSYLKARSMEHVFQIAEHTLKELKLGNIEWKAKYDREECDQKILHFCNSEDSELYTCNTPSWASYLDSFESAMRSKNSAFLQFRR